VNISYKENNSMLKVSMPVKELYFV